MAVAVDAPLRFLYHTDRSFRRQIESATIFTRIYSPTRPAAVDVWFTFICHAGAVSVQFSTSLLFRVVNPLAEAALPCTSDPLDHRGRISQGWTRMLQHGQVRTLRLSIAALPTPAKISRIVASHTLDPGVTYLDP